MPPSLNIVIVNWNAGPQLQRCVESIAAASRDGFELQQVIIVDNASTDGSAEGLQPGTVPLVILRNAFNRGFAAACNQGAREGRGEYLLFLNPDIVLTGASLAVAVAFMEANKNSQVAACGVQLVDGCGNITPSCSRFPHPRDFYAHMFGLHHLGADSTAGSLMCDGNHCQTRPVDVVMGAFLLLRRTVFELVGGFDERFFVYYEEVDLLWQVRRAGWQSCCLASVHAVHKGGGCSSQARAARLFFSLRSRILYSRKHFSRASALCLTLATLLIEPFSRIVYAAGRRRTGEVADTLKACAKLWIWLIGSLSPGPPGSMQASTGTDLFPEK